MVGYVSAAANEKFARIAHGKRMQGDFLLRQRIVIVFYADISRVDIHNAIMVVFHKEAGSRKCRRRPGLNLYLKGTLESYACGYYNIVPSVRAFCGGGDVITFACKGMESTALVCVLIGSVDIPALVSVT